MKVPSALKPIESPLHRFQPEATFVMTDEDGRFDGTVVDNETLDYCYAHITPTDRAVACGLLIREK
jgi:hypothetical protein